MGIHLHICVPLCVRMCVCSAFVFILICSLSRSVFVDVSEDACVCCLGPGAVTSVCTTVCACLHTYAVDVGCRGCPGLPGRVSHLGILSSCASVCTACVRMCILPWLVSALQRTRDCIDLMCRMAIGQRNSHQQHVHLTQSRLCRLCVSPRVYTSAPLSPRAHLKAGGGGSPQGGGEREEAWEARMPGLNWSQASLRGEGAAGRGQPPTCLPSMAPWLQLRATELGSAQLSQKEASALPMVSLTSCSPAPATHSLCDLGYVASPLLHPLQNGLSHWRPAGRPALRSVRGSREGSEGKRCRKW